MTNDLCGRWQNFTPAQASQQLFPVQDNSCDCGLFLLAYMDFFTHSLPEDISKANLKEQHGVFEATSQSHPALGQYNPTLFVIRLP